MNSLSPYWADSLQHSRCALRSAMIFLILYNTSNLYSRKFHKFVYFPGSTRTHRWPSNWCFLWLNSKTVSKIVSMQNIPPPPPLLVTELKLGKYSSNTKNLIYYWLCLLLKLYCCSNCFCILYFLNTLSFHKIMKFQLWKICYFYSEK